MLQHLVNYRRKGAINWHWLVCLEAFHLPYTMAPFIFCSLTFITLVFHQLFLFLTLFNPSPTKLDVTCVYFRGVLSFSPASVFLSLSFCNYRHVFTHLHSLQHAVCYTWRWSMSCIACGVADVYGSCLFASFFLNLPIPLFLTLAVTPCHLAPPSFSFISSLFNCSHLLSFRLDFLYVSLIFLSFLPSSSSLLSLLLSPPLLPPPPDRYHPSLHCWLGWLALLSVFYLPRTQANASSLFWVI